MTAMGDGDARMREALASITPLERILWGRAVRRNINRPDTRLSLMIPKHGVRAATQNVVGNLWRAPVLVAFFTVFLIYLFGSGAVATIAGFAFTIVFVMCMPFSVFRFITSIRSSRKYRRDAKSGSPTH
jgi:hypothetical protein